MSIYRNFFVFFCLVLFSSGAFSQVEKHLSVEAGPLTNFISQDFSEYKVRAYSPRIGFYAGPSYTLPFLKNSLVLGGFLEYTRLKDFSESTLTDESGQILAVSSKSSLRTWELALQGLYMIRFGKFEIGAGAKFNFLMGGSSKNVYPFLKVYASPNYLKPFDVRLPVQLVFQPRKVGIVIRYERGLVDRNRGKGGVREFNNVLKMGVAVSF